MYNKLYLASGGGIVSEAQQAEQADDAVSLLIGLGGTGIDCLRTIKTQVYDRIKPDADSGAVPKYDHIRFLGVDTDNQSKVKEEKNTTYLGLEEDELFYLSGASIAALKSTIKDVKKCYDWVSDDLEKQNFAGNGASGYRQVGRYLLMSQADAFMAEVSNIIKTMREGTIDKRVEIHVFSGMSGGTGSGTFLDVCYMLKEITKDIVGANGEPIVDILGYFFLPDINISKSDQNYLRGNGYAAMQELDYCMNLDNNGGTFTQLMKGGKTIKWDEPPVDLCHLISSVNSAGNIPKNAYDYAMQVVSEYVLDFLVKQAGFNVKSHLTNTKVIIAGAETDKEYGYNIKYYSIGGACGIVPVKEINTYLVSRIYSTFDGKDTQPTQDEVDGFAIELWKAPVMQKSVLDRLYTGIMNIIQKNGASNALEPYDGKAAEVLKGNEDFKEWYEHRVSSKKAILEQNKKMYLTDSNKTSFVAEMKEILNSYLEDIDMGPTYVCNLLNGANGHNLINILDGLIEKARLDYQDEYGYDTGKLNELVKAEQEFMNISGLDKLRIGTLFKTYETRLADYSNHSYKLELYNCIKDTLIECKAKVESMLKNYYNKLNSIYLECKNTFSANLNYLTTANDPLTTNDPLITNDFYEEIISIKDENLQKILNDKIEAFKPANVFKGMVHSWIANEEAWKSEVTIVKMITDYFVGKDGVFADFASKTIQNYLEFQYDTEDIGEIAAKFKKDRISKLEGKSAPLFAYNKIPFTGGNIKEQHISIPTTAPSIKKAAGGLQKKTPQWKLIDSSNSDRILFNSLTCAFPICVSTSNTYQNVKYEKTLAGRHYYEQLNDEEKGIFRDWRKLPPLLPYSLYDFSELKDDDQTELAKIMRQTRWIIQKEEEYQLVDDDGYIYDLSDEYIEKVNDLAGKMKEIETNSAQSAKELSESVKVIEEGIEELCEMPKLMKTEEHFQMKGVKKTKEDISRLRKDAIGYSPCYQMKLKRTIQQVDEIERKIESIKAHSEELEKKVKLKTIGMNEFVYALCTGVIQVSGVKVGFEKIDDGIPMGEVVLSDIDDKYKYGKYLPIYQAFKSFSQLDEQDYAYVEKQNIEKMHEDKEELQKKAKELRILDDYSDERIKSWIQVANSVCLEELKAVQEFARDFKNQFSVFCTMNQIS